MQIASVWIFADIGYYTLLPVAGFDGGYNGSPIALTVYYSIWTIIALFAFWDLLHTRPIIEKRKTTYILLLLGSAMVAVYLYYVLPLLPDITWTPSWMPPSELLHASPWYFLPKSIDILLQQVLVLALVLSFYVENYNIKTISTWCAMLFGGAHLLLAVGGGGFIYAAVFTIVAVVSSFIFPYLMLEKRNGFIYSYFLHWLFYAIVIVLTKLVFRV